MIPHINPHLPVWLYHTQRNARLSVLTRRDAEFRVLRRMLADPPFKQRLIEMPKQAMESELECAFPDGCEIRIVEDSEFRVHLVLPMKPDDALVPPSSPVVDDYAAWVAEQHANSFASVEGIGGLVRKAWEDSNLRRELLASPCTVLERELGLSGDVEVVVVAEEQDCIYLVIPWLRREEEIGSAWLNTEMDSIASHYHGVIIGSTHHNPDTAICCTSFTRP